MKRTTVFRLFCFLMIVCITVIHPAEGYAGDEKKHSSSRYLYKIAIAAIFQNESPYLKEWIEYHKLIGVQHFYLYNNNSQDHFREVLKPYLMNGEVDLIDWPYASNKQKEWTKIQSAAYSHALKMATGFAQWVAILDIDEFIVPNCVDNLSEFLEDYEPFAAVCVNWQMFGTSDISRIPANKLLIESLLMKAPEDFEENVHVKSIVRPEVVLDVVNPHFVILYPGQLQVNPSKEIFTGPFSPYISTDKIQINHYWTRDEHYFYKHKMGRRENWNDDRQASEKRLKSLNGEKDVKILRFIPRLKKQMESSL